MSIKNQVISGVKWTTISTVVLAFTAILQISILTRYLDKSDFGLMALLTFVIGFMNLFNDMGLSSAILHKQEISKEEYASLYWFNLMVGFVMFALLWIISPLIASFYNQPRLSSLIPLLGINLIISSIGLQFKTIESKHLLFKEISLIDISATAISFILSIFLAIYNYGVLALVYAALTKSIISNALYLCLGLKKYGLLFYYRFSKIKSFLRIGIYSVGGQVVSYFNGELDVLLIGKLFPPGILGGYSLAKQLVMRPVQVINPIFMKVAAPSLAKFQLDAEALKRNYLKVINVLSSVNLAIYLVIIIFAPIIVRVMYGDGYMNIVVLVRILSVYMIMRSLWNPITSLVIATGRTDLEFKWSLITVLTLPLFIVLGAKFGIVGVATSMAFAMVVMFIPSWKFLINKMTGATLGEYLSAILRINFKTLMNFKESRL